MRQTSCWEVRRARQLTRLPSRCRLPACLLAPPCVLVLISAAADCILCCGCLLLLALLPADSFRKDVLAILAAVPARRQLLALSATYAPAALDRLRRMMGGRQQEVLLCAEDTALLGVRQCYRMLGAAGGGSSRSGAGAAGAAPMPQQQLDQQGGQEGEQPAGNSSGSGAAAAGRQLEVRLAALLQLLSDVSFQQAVVFCKYKAGGWEPWGCGRGVSLASASAAMDVAFGQAEAWHSPPGAPLLTPLRACLQFCLNAYPSACLPALPSLACPALACPADAEEVAERLLAEGYPAAYLSAQRTQLQRIEALNALRDFRCGSGVAQHAAHITQRAWPSMAAATPPSQPPCFLMPIAAPTCPLPLPASLL